MQMVSAVWTWHLHSSQYLPISSVSPNMAISIEIGALWLWESISPFQNLLETRNSASTRPKCLGWNADGVRSLDVASSYLTIPPYIESRSKYGHFNRNRSIITLRVNISSPEASRNLKLGKHKAQVSKIKCRWRPQFGRGIFIPQNTSLYRVSVWIWPFL